MLFHIEQAALWLNPEWVKKLAFDRVKTPSLTMINTQDKPAQQFAPMLRRRLSPLGKVAVEAALTLYTDHDREAATPMIFLTRWGDIGLSVQLLQSLAQEKCVSPMGFSTSVHNGIAGLFSIAMKHTGPMSTISGAQAQLGAGFYSAAGFLAQGHESVILIGYEEASPKAFSNLHEPNDTYAWALRLKARDSGYQLHCSACSDCAQQTDTMAPLLTLQNLLRQQPLVQERTQSGFYVFTYQG